MRIMNVNKQLLNMGEYLTKQEHNKGARCVDRDIDMDMDLDIDLDRGIRHKTRKVSLKYLSI
jgi:hypothetical protein